MSVNSFWKGVFPLAVDLAVLWYSLTIIDFDTKAAADHLEKLEARINLIARQPLLTWEMQNGLRAKPMGGRLRQRVNEYVRVINNVARRLVEKNAPYARILLSEVRRLARFPRQ